MAVTLPAGLLGPIAVCAVAVRLPVWIAWWRLAQRGRPETEPGRLRSSEMAGMWITAGIMSASTLLVLAPCGLRLALGCRRLWRLGYRRVAWIAGLGLGIVTVAASLVAGLLGPVVIAIHAIMLRLPVWGAWWWPARRA